MNSVIKKSKKWDNGFGEGVIKAGIERLQDEDQVRVEEGRILSKGAARAGGGAYSDDEVHDFFVEKVQIINLMMHTIFMAYKRGLDEKDVKSINNFLGENFTKERLKEIQEDPKRDTYRQFLEIYLKKLRDMGYKSTSYLVRNVENNAPVYYLIFATTSDKAYSMYKNVEPTVKELMEEEWMKKLRFKIKPIVERDQDQLMLGVFPEQ